MVRRVRRARAGAGVALAFVILGAFACNVILGVQDLNFDEGDAGANGDTGPDGDTGADGGAEGGTCLLVADASLKNCFVCCQAQVGDAGTNAFGQLVAQCACDAGCGMADACAQKGFCTDPMFDFSSDFGCGQCVGMRIHKDCSSFIGTSCVDAGCEAFSDCFLGCIGL
jgi:hypothetical protein